MNSGTGVLSPPAEPGLEGLRGLGAVGHDPLLAALAQDAHGALGAVERVDVEARELGDAHAGGVQQLEDRHVADARDAADGARVDQVGRLVDRQERHQLPWLPGAAHLPRGIGRHDAPANEEPQAATERGQLAADGGRLQSARVQRREPGAHRARVGGGQAAAVAVGQEALELVEVGTVAAEGVGGGVSLDREMTQERGERILHATVISASRVKSQPSRTQRCVRTPRATRSVRNGAAHLGHGSATGRCHTTKLQSG